MATSKRLLATLRQIASATSEQQQLINVTDAEQLSELGLVEVFNVGLRGITHKYQITPTGREVLRKADEDPDPEQI
jgi:hypothetical protein